MLSGLHHGDHAEIVISPERYNLVVDDGGETDIWHGLYLKVRGNHREWSRGLSGLKSSGVRAG